jgi:hypothetical protein
MFFVVVVVFAISIQNFTYLPSMIHSLSPSNGKLKKDFTQPSFLSFYILHKFAFTKGAYLLEDLLPYVIPSDTSAALTFLVSASAMLVLPTVVKCNLLGWDGLQGITLKPVFLKICQ